MDEIAAILARLHGKGAVAEDPRIQLEARIIRETAEHEANIATGWRELFKKSELQSGRRILLAGYGQVCVTPPRCLARQRSTCLAFLQHQSALRDQPVSPRSSGSCFMFTTDTILCSLTCETLAVPDPLRVLT